MAMTIADYDINLVEKAFIAAVADLEGMTVDKDIFPGAVPPRCEGAAVWVTGEKVDNNPHRPEFYVEYAFKHTDRRTVMSKVFSLAKKLPVWGLQGAVGEETVKFAMVLKNHLEISRISDDGQIKYLGVLEMSVTI